MSDGLSQQASQPPLAGGGGGGGAAGPTGTWSEDASVGDDLTVRTALAEDASVGDDLTVRTALAEDASVNDAWSAIIAANYAEDASVNDLLRVTLNDVIVGRTGTPDTDLMGDGWTDQAATGVNHGNENLIVKGKSTLANDERRAHLFIDLSQFTGWTAAGTGLTVRVVASNAGALTAETVTWSATDTAARSFTESTLTWANQPATSTTRGTGTFSVPAGGASAAYTFTISPANLAACLGRWLLITFTCATAALPNSITILSRETTADINKPRYSANYVQRGS